MLWFSWQKLGDPVAFLKAIHSYDILPTRPPWILDFSAIWIPVIEFLAGLCLITGIGRRGAALATAGMLVVFTLAVWMRALDLHHSLGGAFCAVKFDCGCGGGEVYICAKLAENLALILGASWAALGPVSSPIVPGVGDRQSE